MVVVMVMAADAAAMVAVVAVVVAVTMMMTMITMTRMMTAIAMMMIQMILCNSERHVSSHGRTIDFESYQPTRNRLCTVYVIYVPYSLQPITFANHRQVWSIHTY